MHDEVRKCICCGKEFKIEPFKYSQKYCSTECLNRYRKDINKNLQRERNKHNKKGYDREMICVKCGNTYIGHFNSKYCNDCLSIGNRNLRQYANNRVNPVEISEEREPKICKCCGKEFTKYHGNQRYCSEECKHEAYRLSQNAYHRKWYSKNMATGRYKEKTCCVCGNKYIGIGRSAYCDNCLSTISKATMYRLKRRNERKKMKESK